MSNDDARCSGRTADGRFTFGNPGRQPGTRYKSTIAAQDLLDGEADRLTRKAIELALEGDPVALRLCLERILPARKDRPVSFPLPKAGTAAEGAVLTEGLIASVAAGEVTPEEGNVVASLIEKHVRIRDASNFEARLQALEKRIGNGDGK
jgi:hypothetical protein